MINRVGLRQNTYQKNQNMSFGEKKENLLLEVKDRVPGWRETPPALTSLLRNRYPVSLAVAGVGTTAAMTVGMANLTTPANAVTAWASSMLPMIGVTTNDFLRKRNQNLDYVEGHEGGHAIGAAFVSNIFEPESIKIETSNSGNNTDPERVFCQTPMVEKAYFQPRRVFTPETPEDAAKVGIAHMIMTVMPQVINEQQIGYDDQIDAYELDSQQLRYDIHQIFPLEDSKGTKKIEKQVRETAKALLQQVPRENVETALAQIAQETRNNNGVASGERITAILQENNLWNAMPPLTEETLQKVKSIALLEK